MTAILNKFSTSLNKHIIAKLNGQTLAAGMTESDVAQLIAKDFSAAAMGYHEHNILQKRTAIMLCQTLSPTGTLLDIGAGPGTDFSVFSKVKQVVTLDIASGMLAKLKENFPQYQAITGDAQCLPLQNNSINAIYSNLALQWCPRFKQAMSEAARVLMPSGTLDMSVVTENSLPELEHLGFKVNRFQAFDDLVAHFDAREWQIKEAKLVPVTVYFEDLKSLLYSIKGVGASVLIDKPLRPVLQLRGRQDWLSLNKKANSLKQARGIPLTYYIAIIRAKRKYSLV
ncbi:methyltransferase domain-containing protein [Shewanella surugensis]|uniref:Methyltransferase domain-containing protein n=1 Tax=Shewanella surugensis TaxID=212020 RepID=A0ABT0L7Z5_9GAMM|nr:methyltransferase domain-containing protein [Shewanella surugensis]MCL1123630.1 methyltransferase domain-containing protein [Shewanella surugensis]